MGGDAALAGRLRISKVNDITRRKPARLRIAILSSLEVPDHQTGQPRAAYRTFGGSRLIDRQLQLALDAGCRHIFCLVDAIGREIVELQHKAERAGARFVTVRDGSGLLGAASASDEVLALMPGLLPDEETVLSALDRPSVFCLPADIAVPLGYERIDLGDAWAGVILTRASALEQIGHLPPDVDPFSVLLRASLQMGIARRQVDPAVVYEGDWQLAPAQADLDERAVRLIRRRAQFTPFLAPGTAVAERMGARLAQDLIGRGSAALPTVLGVASACLSLVAAFAELPLIALAMATLTAIAVSINAVIDRTVALHGKEGRFAWLEKAALWLRDPVFLVAMAAAGPEADGWLRLYVPTILLAVLLLGERLVPRPLSAAFGDRVTLGVLMTLAGVVGGTQICAAGLTLVALLIIFRLGTDE